MAEQGTRSLTQKLIDAHLVSGAARTPGKEVEIRIDQVLLQDASGPTALLHFEAMGFARVKQKTAVMYGDHQTIQVNSLHTDAHRFMLGFCRKHGIHFSKPGNGICHNVHLEEFSVPGESLLGTDSHTPQGGAVGMLAVGAGGMDVATAMATGATIIPRPAIVEVRLSGKLGAWATAKDVILELLRRLGARGGIGKYFEYTGPGLRNLTVPERFTIASMGTELGLTGSIFPSDAQTRTFYERIGRAADWKPQEAEANAEYDERIELDLGDVQPLVALPSNPENVVPVSEATGTPVHQVIIGSCTNGTFTDVASFAQVLRGRKVADGVDAIVFPGSRQAFEELAREGHLADLLAAGVCVSESTCGSCPGYAHIPAPGMNSLRAFNRNFKGRSGLSEDAVYLASPELAAVAALHGEIRDPRDEGAAPEVLLPYRFASDRTGIVAPAEDPAEVEIVRGPNIQPVQVGEAPGDSWTGEVLIKLGDNVSTDHISPAGVEAITYRTNMPALADFTFRRVDATFASRAREAGGGVIVGAKTYGQGSAREQAAICPMILGVRAVIAKSFARIHRANLINWGILPLTFVDEDDYDKIDAGQTLSISNIENSLATGHFQVENTETGYTFSAECPLTERERRMLAAGGALALARIEGGGSSPAEIQDGP
ncbi:MAG: aconitate hydratase [Nitrospinae bacterium]|nr:aconitate hydratase [Nitrospinota bacterium]